MTITSNTGKVPRIMATDTQLVVLPDVVIHVQARQFNHGTGAETAKANEDSGRGILSTIMCGNIVVGSVCRCACPCSRRFVAAPKCSLRLRVRNHCGCLQVEWRTLGVQQSKGWVHYAVHRPEPHVLLFRYVVTCQVTSR